MECKRTRATTDIDTVTASLWWRGTSYALATLLAALIGQDGQVCPCESAGLAQPVGKTWASHRQET
eukprot:2120709-Alexandrium_andersonii.AAC.1